MTHKRNKPLLAKFALISLVLGLVVFSTGYSLSKTFDTEIAQDNTFAASSLDMALDSNTADFDPSTPLTPGDNTQREIFVQNVGQLPFQYSQEFEMLAGSDTQLCNALQLQVDYQYVGAGPIVNSINKYSGPLADFSINIDGGDPDFDHPNTYPYYTNTEYGPDEQWLKYTVSLPSGADPNLQNLSCNFGIRANAWQENFASYPQGFHDTEILENTVSSAEWYLAAPENLGYNENNGNGDDYAAPRPNTEIACGGITAINGVSHHWTEVTGSGGNIKYQRQYQTPSNSTWSGNEIYSTPYSNFRTFGGGIGNPGTYNSRVRAFYDNNNNNAVDPGELTSDWSSNSCQITYDPIAPAAPTLTVTNSPTKIVEERITNGDFENGLEAWTHEGDVIATTADGYTTPKGGSQMARIGVTEDTGNNIAVNILSQAIPKGVRSIGFDYNFFTKEDSGFDDPGMMVFVNNKQVQQIWADDVIDPDCSEAGNCSTGWQHMNVYVGDVEDATLSIAFYAGNTGDTLGQSWLYIDDVSTSDVVVNGSALFKLNLAQDAGTYALPYYQIGTNTDPVQGDSFTISSQPAGDIISYWSEDAAHNQSAKQIISVTFDDSPPAAIDNLAAEEGFVLGEYELDFTAPTDDNFSSVNQYEVRYATGAFDHSVSWDSLPVANFVGFSGVYEAPRAAGKLEGLLVQGLLPAQQYYFAVKSKDAANNWSFISNVAAVNVDLGVAGIADSPIVINEFLPDPNGDDAAAMPEGEWVELYNNSDTPVDVVGWVLYDNNDTHALPISLGNSDNNLDTSDGGETIVPAFGYLTVYRNGNSGFELDQTDVDGQTDSVRLYDGDISTGTLIDEHEYTGNVPEGKSIAREYDGVGMFIDPEPTPGRKNAMTLDELEPQVRLFKVDDTHAKLSIFDGLAYEAADYSLLYTRNTNTEAIREALENSVAPIASSRVDVNNIYFGTCSSGGSCIDHLDLSDVSVGVELLKSDGSSKTLEYKLEGAW